MPADRSRSTLYLLLSVVVVDLIGFGIVMPILPFYAVRFGASGFELGMLLASYAAMQLVFAPLWGRLSDRIGRRPVLLLTIAGTALSLGMLGLADTLPLVFGARMLAGVFGANISVATAYASDISSDEERTGTLGMIGAAFAVGFVVGPAIAMLLAPDADSLHIPLYAAAVMAAGNWIFAALRLPEPEVHRNREAGGSQREVLADPRVRSLCGANLLFTIAVSQLETLFALLMLDRFDYGPREVAGILVATAIVMGGVQGGLVRRLAPRYGEPALLRVGTALLALNFALIPFMPSVALLLIPLFGAAIGRGVGQPAMIGMVSLCAGPEQRGLVMGTFQSAASLARVVGPALAGLLYDASVAAPFLLAAVLLVAVVAIASGTGLRGVSGAGVDTQAEASPGPG